METILKYYKYVDSETGKVKKDVGIVTTRLAVKAKRKVEADKSLTTVFEEKFTVINENKPQVDAELVEISVEEFNQISDEDLVDAKKFARFTRIKERVNRIQERREQRTKKKFQIDNKVEKVTDEEFAALQDKQEKGESILEAVKEKKDKKDK